MTGILRRLARVVSRTERHGGKAWPDGTRYAGGLRAGKLHGRGVVTFPDGMRHEGEWRDGVPVAARPERSDRP